MQLVVNTAKQPCTFDVRPKMRTKKLFNLLCTSLKIQETWYFGLMYYGPDNEEIWMDQSNKTLKSLQDNSMKLQFKVKHFPENVNELIEPITIEYFFYEVESSILKDEITCSADTCILLASYALQAKYGDYNSYEHDEDTLSRHKLLPERLRKQHTVSMSEWHSDIIKMWRRHNSLDKEDAMLKYLKLAEKLDMYGIRYFRIANKERTDLTLGVTATGINIYEDVNRSKPITSYPWSEIRNMTYIENKFTLNLIEKSAKDVVIFTQNLRASKSVLNVAMGSHFLNMKRRLPESPEVAKLRENARQTRKARNYQKQ